MSKHTPGKWKVRLMAQANYPGKRWGVYGPEMEYVASCDSVGESQDAKNEANARLIAAAPDLLAALEGIAGEQFTPQAGHNTYKLDAMLSEIQECASDAIAKAEEGS